MSESGGGSATRRRVAGAVVSLLGVCFYAVPLYDIWDDVSELNWQLSSTLIENSPLLFLATVLVVGGVWVTRRDLATRHVETVATWTVAGSVVAALAFVWVGALQLWTMHELKPLVLGLDGILIAGVAAFGIGVNRARTEDRQETLEREREKFAGLFTNTTDAVAAIAMDATALRTDDVNERFRETFGAHADRVVSDALENLDGPSSLADVRTRLRDGETIESQVTYSEDGEAREDPDERVFIVRFIPYDAEGPETYFYVVGTDVTEQRQLVREQEVSRRLESLHDVESTLQSASTRREAYETAVDAVAQILPDVAARTVLDGDVVASTGDAAGERDWDAADVRRVELESDGAVELADASLDERERTILGLLEANLEHALERIDREQRLEEEREQLEFVNRTIRHNLLNDLQVIRARLQILEPTQESFDEHYDVIADHLDDMAGFVETMRSYMQTVVESDRSTEPRDLRPVVEHEVTKVENAYPEAVVDHEGVPDVAVPADDLLGALFENLLTNAVKHNDAVEPHVTVDGDLEDGEVVVQVADDGPGIPEERRETIFERGEHGRESSGSGFGLFLVSEVVERYGGDVEVRDNEPTGTVFSVTLPTADDAATTTR